MNTDERGWRIALVPDSIVNPAGTGVMSGLNALRALDACGYGLLQLPPPGSAGLLLAVIADEVAEFLRHGYAVVAIGLQGRVGTELHWGPLSRLLRNRGVGRLARHLIRPDADTAAERRRLEEFLAGYDVPQEEQRRWRV